MNKLPERTFYKLIADGHTTKMLLSIREKETKKEFYSSDSDRCFRISWHKAGR
jgi:hypothetical protein